MYIDDDEIKFEKYICIFMSTFPSFITEYYFCIKFTVSQNKLICCKLKFVNHM